MEKINAAITPMREIEIFGFPALFSPHSVSPSTVHLGLCQFEIKAKTGGMEETFSLTKKAQENFYGTVLSLIPIDLPENGERSILPGDMQVEEQSKLYTPAEFERKYFDPDYIPSQFSERYGK